VGTDEVQVAKKFLGNLASLRVTALDLEGNAKLISQPGEKPNQE